MIVISFCMSACRACRDVHVVLCCPTSTTRHVTSRHDFTYANMHGLDSVSCRNVT